MDYFTNPTATLESVPSALLRWTPLLGKTIVHQDVSVKEERLSIMYSVLPASIQSRLPPLPSIRRAVMPMRSITSSGGGGDSYPPPSSSSSTAVSSGATTPITEADETAAAVLDVARTTTTSRTRTRTDETDIAMAFALSQGKTSYRARASVESVPAKVAGSGVDWRCGRQGVDLVANAAQESKDHMRADYNAPFERTAYLDGVAYLLKGLPRDLDRTEATVLRRSLPPALCDTAPGGGEEEVDRGRDGYGDGYGDGGIPRQRQRGSDNRNVVHSALLLVLVYLLACIRWATPYAILLFGELVRCERRYRVSEHLLGSTMAGVAVGVAAVRRLGDGRAGQVLAEAFDYTAEGVSAALKDFAKEVRGAEKR